MIPQLHRFQLEILRCPIRNIVVSAGRGFGKSLLGCVWLPAQLTGPGVFDRQGWYVAQTYSVAKREFWPVVKELLAPAIVDKSESELTVWLRNGSRITMVGADRVESLRSAHLDAIAIDEYALLRPNAWGVFRPMLAVKRGRALIYSTPKGYDHFHDLWRRGDPNLGERRDPEWRAFQFKTADAPHIHPSEIAAARRDLDDQTFRQEYEASFELRQGAIFAQFSRALHVGRVEYFDRLPVFGGVDFNIDHMVTPLCQEEPPTFEEVQRAAVDGLPDPKPRIRQFDEVASRGLWTADHAAKVADVLRRKWGVEPRGVVLYCDATGTARNRAGVSDVHALKQAGFQVRHPPSNPHVEDRFNAFRFFLGSPWPEHRNARRFVVDEERCPQTIEALEKYSYRSGSNPPDPDKTQGWDGAVDSLTYLVSYRHPFRGVSRFI